MSDYTPTAEDVREDYAIGRNEEVGAGWYDEHRVEFDRWIAAHDAEKRAEWEAEQDTLPQCGYCGNNLRGLPGCPTHGAEQGETASADGWYEWLTPGMSLTRIAYVYESGRVYFPEGDDVDESDFLLAAARGNVWRLVRLPVPDTTNNESEGKA